MATLTESHRIATQVEVLVDGQVEQTLDTVTDGNVSFDSGAASRGRCDLTVVTEPGSELIPTDPSSPLNVYGTELQISRGIDGSQLTSLGIYRIDRATADGETVRVSGLDRSAWVIDAAFEDPYNVAAGSDCLTIIEEVVRGGYPQLVTDFVTVSIPLPALIAEEGDDRWAFAQGLATAIGCILYFGDEGELVLRPTPTSITGNPIATIAEGEGGVLLGLERDWDRSPVHNRIIVTAENTTEDTVTRGVATDDNPASPTYYHGGFGKKPMRWSNPYVITADQCNTAAQSILAEKIGAPDVLSFEALVDPARRPWDVVQVERERLGVAENHVLDSVSLPLTASGTMSAATRATQVI